MPLQVPVCSTAARAAPASVVAAVRTGYLLAHASIYVGGGDALVLALDLPPLAGAGSRRGSAARRRDPLAAAAARPALGARAPRLGGRLRAHRTGCRARKRAGAHVFGAVCRPAAGSTA